MTELGAHRVTTNGVMLDKIQRKTRARDAQRRYRGRKEQTLTHALSRSAKLETVVEKMMGALLNFIDLSVKCEIVRSSPTWQIASRETIQIFRVLAAEMDDSDENDYDNRTSNIDSNADLNQKINDGLQTESDEAQSNSFALSERNSMSTRSRALDDTHRPFYLVHKESSRTPSSVLHMPIYKPIMSEDYWTLDFPGGLIIPLGMRVLHHGLLMSYRALRQASSKASQLGAWFSRSHRFTLPHANSSSLLSLTERSLKRLAVDVDQGVASSSLIEDRQYVFRSQDHEHLGRIVRDEIQSSGMLVSDLLSAGDIEMYLQTKGHLSINDSELHLRMKFPGTQEEDQSIGTVHEKLVKVDLNRLIQRLVDGAICMGNGIAFPKVVVNNAIVYSAISLTDIES